MYVDIPDITHLTEQERARETERILREIVIAHNRELDEIRRAMENGKTEGNT